MISKKKSDLEENELKADYRDKIKLLCIWKLTLHFRWNWNSKYEFEANVLKRIILMSIKTVEIYGPNNAE